jgi:hypothetical protein
MELEIKSAAEMIVLEVEGLQPIRRAARETAILQRLWTCPGGADRFGVP